MAQRSIADVFRTLSTVGPGRRAEARATRTPLVMLGRLRSIVHYFSITDTAPPRLWSHWIAVPAEDSICGARVSQCEWMMRNKATETFDSCGKQTDALSGGSAECPSSGHSPNRVTSPRRRRSMRKGGRSPGLRSGCDQCPLYAGPGPSTWCSLAVDPLCESVHSGPECDPVEPERPGLESEDEATEAADVDLHEVRPVSADKPLSACV
jgi:hypothetical protein